MGPHVVMSFLEEMGGRQRDAHARIIAGRSHKADDLYISNDE
jgi:hypothetical protein